ncbi:MAG: hypothetical protein MK132_19765 [Lentisphaerales bacterium]|nr:hypothetical protein [Lentisphaerales bacterium]
MKALSLLFILLFLASCGKKQSAEAPAQADHTELKKAIIENYASIVYANYEDSWRTALELQKKIDSFVANPSAQSFAECKQAWLAAREPYGQTEAFRFAGGPIDDEDGPEGAINAWPLDENYIDYVVGLENGGIINDTKNFPTIDKKTLIDLNEKGGETNISIGFHAIEFLLWGQDSADTKLKKPGQRPYTDFLTEGGTAKNQQRRAAYLKAVAEILVTDLASMKDEWAPDADNYRAKFVDMDTNDALKNILTGIGTLSKSELAGERIFVALDNQDQEDEHSCFSDNTHRDIILNAVGIRNVLKGEYKRVNGSVVKGASIHKLVTKLDPELAVRTENLSVKTVKSSESILVPFDFALTQEKVGGNGPIMTTVLALQAQGDKLTAVAKTIGVTIGTDLPE